MLIVTIRTDNPDAEIGLFEDHTKVAYVAWLAHRQLAETLHQKLRDLLVDNGKSLQQVEGIVVFEGPGSFTGLRIGITVANTLAYSQEIPIMASGGQGWIKAGISKVLAGQNCKIALPEYGALPHITLQKK